MRLTNACSQTSHGASTRPIAVDVLDEHIAGGTFHGDTLVLVGNFDVVNVNVISPYVDAIESSLVSTSNYHIVNLAIGACVHNEMERGSCTFNSAMQVER
jgi:hypothetical protein